MTLVERLRQYGSHQKGSAFRILDEAADHIEQLEAALQEIEHIAKHRYPPGILEIARAVLEERK